jgi:hypothetical protein
LWRTKSAVLHILVIELFELLEKWDDLNAERPFMQIAAANRRNQILGQCWQLNNRRCPNEPIQMDFNFNVDLEELAQENEAVAGRYT